MTAQERQQIDQLKAELAELRAESRAADATLARFQMQQSGNRRELLAIHECGRQDTEDLGYVVPTRERTA
jgi:hypothetical protein